MQGVARDDFQLSGISGCNLLEGREGALVAFDRNHASSLSEEGARQSTRTGPDLDNRHVVERSARPCNPCREIEVQQEILAERLLGAEPVLPDDLPEWRESVR